MLLFIIWRGLRTNFEACDTNSQTMVFRKSRLGVFYWHLGGFRRSATTLCFMTIAILLLWCFCCPFPSNANDMHITSHLIRSRKYFPVPSFQSPPPPRRVVVIISDSRVQVAGGDLRENACVRQAVSLCSTKTDMSAECTMCAYNYHEQSFILQWDSFSRSAQLRHEQVTEILSN